MRDGRAAWSALALVEVGGVWRLCAACAGAVASAADGPGTVPVAELRGARAALLLGTRLAAALAGRATDEVWNEPCVANAAVSEGLSAAEIFRLDVLVSVSWRA